MKRTPLYQQLQALYDDSNGSYGSPRLWLTDIAHSRTPAGWLYAAVVLNLYSRRIVGWAMASRMTRASI